jgi:glucose/arabinose dehydrogenase
MGGGAATHAARNAHPGRPGPSTTLGMMALALFTLGGCRADATPTPATPATMQHHEVRADRLPPPFATPSASKSPDIISAPPNAKLVLPPGFKIAKYASGLNEPRNMLLAPNGDVFVTETGAGRIAILRDTNRDGVADKRFVFASDRYQPYGLAFHDGFLYVGEANAIVRFPYTAGQTAAKGEPQKIASLPSGGHSTRNIIFSRDGTKLYVAVGSRGNVETGDEPVRAAISEMNPDGTAAHVFAGGLRNPVGLDWEPVTGALWTAVNERDGRGDELVPDYVTDVRRGAFYGWPYAYIGPHEDPELRGRRPDLVKQTTVPSLLIDAHSAALGVVFYNGNMFPQQYRGAAFVALHGSWNRSRLTGYKIISVPFRGGHPAGGYDDFVAGWIVDAQRGTAWGRPVSLLVLQDGSLLITDDGNDTIWRVSYM